MVEHSSKTAAEGRVTVHLPADLARALRLAAADRGVSHSAVVAEALALLFSRKAPPGYQAPPGPDLSPAAALARARELRRGGATWPAVAEALNAAGYRTRRGAEWTAINLVQRLRPRAGAAG